ncbi:MAG TPA: hypothetical protein PKA05_22640 [Roseiflexaceae bacterium]|nr:hypothetical protein [Roseiflexaceae bacterium]
MIKSIVVLVACSIFGGAFAHANQPAASSYVAHLPLLLRPGATPPPAGVSSAELIRAALARGELDAETALVYRVFANYADPRLPDRFRGDDTAGSHDNPAADVADRWLQLAPQTRAVLEPFRIPPYYAGSWWDLRRKAAPAGDPRLAETRLCDDLGESGAPYLRDWQYRDSANGRVRIWWQTIHPEDAVVAREIDALITPIWAHLHNLLRREPPADGGTLTPCRGGDDRLDISLVDIMNSGEVWRYDRHEPQSGPRPTFMLLRRDFHAPAAQLGLTAAQVRRATLIHELMHTFQFAFDMKDLEEYGWWREATANWAIHYVESLEAGWRTNYEHGSAPYRLDDPDFPLDFTGLMQYGAYLYPLSLQLSANGNADVIRMSFERSEQFANSLANLNGLAGGFRSQFPRYVLRNLNRPPVDEYRQLDQLAARAKLAGEWQVDLAGMPSRSYVMDGNVRYLASKSYRFTFPTSEVRSLLFLNPFADGSWPTAVVQALIKINGTWQEADWTTRAGQTYCRDLRAERVEELIITISNVEWADREHTLAPHNQPRLNVTNVACRGWQFEGDAKLLVAGNDQTADELLHVSAVFERYRLPGDDGGARSGEMYQLREAQATWSHTGQGVFCAGSGQGAFVPAGGSNALLFLRPYAADENLRGFSANDRRYHGYGNGSPENFNSQFVIYICQDGGTHRVSITTVAKWWLTEVVPTQQISADGTTINGSFVFDINEGEPGLGIALITYTWKMTALPPE